MRMDNQNTYRAPQLAYHVMPLRDNEGHIAKHFLTGEFAASGTTWEQAMDDPVFAQIINRELAAEHIAHSNLEHLSVIAPNERVRSFYLTWVRFIDYELQPWTTGGAIHFRPHWARVLMLALTLGDAEGLPDADLRALAMAAVFHDSRRKNPYLDTGHGMRGSLYYQEACEQGAKRGEYVDPSANSAGREPNEDQTRAADKQQPGSLAQQANLVFDPRTLLAIRWHDRDDEDGFEAFKRAQSILERTPTDTQADVAFIYRLLKDADGLDRVRLGPHQLDPHYLRTQMAINSVAFANELLEASSKQAPQQ